MNLPNLLTISRMLLAPVLLAVFHAGTLTTDLVALLILVYAGVTDLLDGYLARTRNIASPFGKVMDPLSDSFVFLSLFGCFVHAGWMPVWVFAIFVLREVFMHTFLRPYFLMRGVALGAKSAGKLKTALQNVVGYAVLLAIMATRSWSTRPGSARQTLMAVSSWALLLVALVSAVSLHAYVAELWRSRPEAKAPASG